MDTFSICKAFKHVTLLIQGSYILLVLYSLLRERERKTEKDRKRESDRERDTVREKERERETKTE